jgi:hypothetical protein
MKKPSERDPGLKFIIEWMDETYKEDDGQSYFLCQSFRTFNSSFDDFMENKREEYMKKVGKSPAKIYQFKKR